MRHALLTRTGGGGVSGGWRCVPDHQPAVKETAGFSFSESIAMAFKEITKNILFWWCGWFLAGGDV